MLSKLWHEVQLKQAHSDFVRDVIAQKYERGTKSIFEIIVIFLCLAMAIQASIFYALSLTSGIVFLHCRGKFGGDADEFDTDAGLRLGVCHAPWAVQVRAQHQLGRPGPHQHCFSRQPQKAAYVPLPVELPNRPLRVWTCMLGSNSGHLARQQGSIQWKQ